jgi:hypothetical protein
VIDVGRRDLVRRERAKLTAAHATTAARPAESLPAWLGTDASTSSRDASAFTDLAPAQPAARPTPGPTATWPTAARRHRSRQPRVPFVSASLLELVDRRAQAQAVVRKLDAELANAVGEAHAAGASWPDIAGHLGVTRQAARQRYGLAGAPVRRVARSSTDSGLAGAVAAARH